MRTFGENLRQIRESKGITLEQISVSTRISIRLLKAIEDEQFHLLPGGVFNVSFVRQYARSVGAEEEKTVAEFEKLLPQVELDLEEHFQVESSESPAQLAAARIAEGFSDFLRRRSSALIRTFAAVALLTFSGVLYWMYDSERDFDASLMVDSQVESADGVQTEPAAVTPVQSQPNETKPSQPLNVELQIVEKVWIRAAADGQRVLERTLREGERRTIGAYESVRLLVGNAGGVEIALNGEKMPPIGPRGHVRRVLLTTSGMEILEPQAPAPSTEEPTTAASAQTPEAVRGSAPLWVNAAVDSR